MKGMAGLIIADFAICDANVYAQMVEPVTRCQVDHRYTEEALPALYLCPCQGFITLLRTVGKLMFRNSIQV